MKTRKKFYYQLAITFALLLFLTSSASATSIIKLGLGEIEAAPDLQFTGGVLSSVSDGNASTSGEQNTSVNYIGFLEPLLADIIAGGSFSLNGVTAIGAASVNGLQISQATTGGTFNLYDDSNNLLLSGDLDEGAISGGMDSTVGSFFTTNVADFTGGQLLSFLTTTPAAISFALGGILSEGGIPGLSVNQQGNLNPFTATADGVIDGTPIPEPASAALLFSGLFACAARRRSAVKN